LLPNPNGWLTHERCHHPQWKPHAFLSTRATALGYESFDNEGSGAEKKYTVHSAQRVKISHSWGYKTGWDFFGSEFQIKCIPCASQNASWN
jgi:hypothetical protein